MRILCYTERLTGRSVLYDPFIIKVRKESKVMAARAWRLESGEWLFRRYGSSVQQDISVLQISLIAWSFPLILYCISKRGDLVLYALPYHNSS